MAKQFLFLIVFSCFYSCTVEKRLYNKGFHIEWKSKYKSKDLVSENEKQVEKTVFSAIDSSKINYFEISQQVEKDKFVELKFRDEEANVNDEIYTNFDKKIFENKIVVPEIKNSLQQKVLILPKQKKINKEEKVESNYDFFAVSSFFIALLIGLFLYFYSYGSLFFIIGIVICSIIAFLFSIIGLKRTKHRKKESRGFAIVALILSSLAIAVQLLVYLIDKMFTYS